MFFNHDKWREFKRDAAVVGAVLLVLIIAIIILLTGCGYSRPGGPTHHISKPTAAVPYHQDVIEWPEYIEPIDVVTEEIDGRTYTTAPAYPIRPQD